MRKRASGRERPQQGALTCLPAPTPQFLLGDGRYDPFSPAPLVHSCCLGCPPSFSTVFVLAWYSGAASSSLPMREAGVDHERHSARQDCELWFTDSHLVVGCASHSCLAVSFNSIRVCVCVCATTPTSRFPTTYLQSQVCLVAHLPPLVPPAATPRPQLRGSRWVPHGWTQSITG